MATDDATVAQARLTSVQTVSQAKMLPGRGPEDPAGSRGHGLTHEEPEVEPARVDEPPLEDVRMTA